MDLIAPRNVSTRYCCLVLSEATWIYRFGSVHLTEVIECLQGKIREIGRRERRYHKGYTSLFSLLASESIIHIWTAVYALWQFERSSDILHLTCYLWQKIPNEQTSGYADILL